jgi:DNA-directed RNA polymerase specialized sigma24 family protein
VSASAGNFAATRWTLVVQARGGDAAAQSALSELCEAYYAPVLTFLRSEGREEDAARDLAHEFFARVLAGGSLRGADPARGRFRSYLLGAVKHFLRDVRAKNMAEKRGGGQETIPLEDTASGLGVASPNLPDCERAFDRQWALTVIGRSLETIRGEHTGAEKTRQFEVLKPWITGENPHLSQLAAAVELGMNEGAVKVAIHRLRQRFREAVKSEISQTVPAESDIDDELRHLIAVLSSTQQGSGGA